MSKLPVKDMHGKSAGEVDLSDDLLEFERGAQVMKDAIVAYLANQRQGSASTLHKGEVAGSNRKLWKQKGTGRARTGRRQSPIWRGGGTCFGPKPRSFRKAMNRKSLQLALRRAVGEAVKEEKVTVLKELKVEEAKTKVIAALLNALGLERTVLLITKDVTDNVSLSARNINRLEITTAQNVNVYELTRFHHIIIEQAALGDLEARLNNASTEEVAA